MLTAPVHVCMYTGDDFNYPNSLRRRAGQEPTPLPRILRCHCAAPPRLLAVEFGTFHGTFERSPVAAYLQGPAPRLCRLQDHFVMIGGSKRRSLPHLAELFRLADRAGLLRVPTWRAAAWSACWPCTGLLDARFLPGRCASVHQYSNLTQACSCRRSCSSRHPQHSPWRDQVGAAGKCRVVPAGG